MMNSGGGGGEFPKGFGWILLLIIIIFLLFMDFLVWTVDRGYLDMYPWADTFVHYLKHQWIEAKDVIKHIF